MKLVCEAWFVLLVKGRRGRVSRGLGGQRMGLSRGTTKGDFFKELTEGGFRLDV